MYRVAIRNNQTGEVRIREYPTWDWDDHQFNFWTTGNFSCDCNRALEWLRADGEDETAEWKDATPCGHTRFTVLYAEMPDGSQTVIDEE
jgi:hypothetical protein